MTASSRHSMDGPIQAGDVVVYRVSGTRDLYLIATVASAVEDLTLDNVLTAKGQAAAICSGYERRPDNRGVWLFAGSAAAYVKAPLAKRLTEDRPISVTEGLVVQ